MRPLSALIVLIWFSSCTENRAKNSIASKKDTMTMPKAIAAKPIKYSFSTIDSLNKYRDSLYCVIHRGKGSEFNIFSGVANGVRFGIAPVSDSNYAFFEEIDKEWEKKYTLPSYFSLGSILLVDLLNNGDSCIMIFSGNYYGMSGNRMTLILSFNKKDKSFHYCKGAELYNCYYSDNHKPIIGSQWSCTNATEGRKELYEIKGDSLIFYKGVAMGLALGAPDHVPYIAYYTKRGNEEIITKRIRYKSEEKMEAVYQHLLWDSSNFPD